MTNTESAQIGTVEVLAVEGSIGRIYQKGDRPVLIPPGVYPFFVDGDGLVFWRMRGHYMDFPKPIFEDLDSPGMFLMHTQWPRATDEAAEYESKHFTPEEFRGMGPVKTEGHPEQRLRFEVDIRG